MSLGPTAKHGSELVVDRDSAATSYKNSICSYAVTDIVCEKMNGIHPYDWERWWPVLADAHPCGEWSGRLDRCRPAYLMVGGWVRKVNLEVVVMNLRS